MSSNDQQQAKKCLKCGSLKPITEFSSDARKKDGRDIYCRMCANARYREYRKSPKGRAAKERYESSEQGRSVRAFQHEEWYGLYIKGALTTLKASARKRGIPVDITAEDLQGWWKRAPDKCHYCGITPHEFVFMRDCILQYQGSCYEIVKFRKAFSNPKHAKIDRLTVERLDNGRGYEIGNLAKCCWFCNRIKSDLLTEADMRKIAGDVILRLRNAIRNSRQETG